MTKDWHVPRIPSRALALLLLLPGSGLAARAQLAPAVAANVPGEGYRISGRVVDARSGGTLPRCTVEIADVRRGRGARTVQTGEDGRFVFDGVAPSKYRLSASKRGFLTQTYEEHDNYSTAIAVGPGLVSQDLIFKLTPGAILTGTVTDDAGEPVRQAEIKLFRDQDADGLRITIQTGQDRTDDRGVYEISGVRPGSYFLSVYARPWYAQQQGADATSEQAALDVAYPTTYYPDVTDADQATPIPIKGGERLQADFTLHPEHTVRLRIPMSQADMRNGYGINVTHSVFGGPEGVPVTAVPSGAGTIDLLGLLPGRYDVSLVKNLAGQQVTKRFSADLSGASAEVSDTSKEDEILVKGTVTSSEGKLPLRGGIALVVLHGRRGYSAPLNDAGEFSVRVPAGSYEVLGQVNHHYLAEISATGAPLVGRVLTVKAGSTPRLKVAVGNSYGQIDGTVLHDGHPASAAMVLLVPDHPGENHILFRRDQSDSDGSFTLPGILPGHYRLVAIERGWELEYANPGVLAPFLVKGRSVNVRGGDRLQGTVELRTR